MKKLVAGLLLSVLSLISVSAQQKSPGAGPILVLDTGKGSIEIETYPNEAPKTVEHILALVKRSFYRGQRIHRVTESLAQFGDPASRDMTRQDYWGRGNSGTPIGVLEIPRARGHQRGAVGLAHGGNPRYADSQIYIMKAASPALDGKHAVIGQVTRGMDVVDRLQVADILKLVTIK